MNREMNPISWAEHLQSLAGKRMVMRVDGLESAVRGRLISSGPLVTRLQSDDDPPVEFVDVLTIDVRAIEWSE